MGTEDIPGAVQRLIAECIDSVGRLEVLLTLHADPEKEWTAEELSHFLRSTPQSASVHLLGLLKCGLAQANANRFRLAALSKMQHEDITALERVFKERPTSVIELIYATPSDRIRALAEAFKIRKKEQT
jgi:hypothetical protein